MFALALREVGTLRMLGSGTMDAMAIAMGQGDVLFQHSVADWDRLPGAAILRGAEGESVVVRGGRRGLDGLGRAARRGRRLPSPRRVGPTLTPSRR